MNEAAAALPAKAAGRIGENADLHRHMFGHAWQKYRRASAAQREETELLPDVL